MIQRRAVTKAMEALIETVTGKPCGVGTVPLVGGKPAPPPYTILYSLDTTVGGAPFADEHEDMSPVYQVTCVSGPDPADPDSRGGVEQAEWLADRVRTGFLGRDPSTGQWVNALTVPGAVCYGRRVDTEPGETNEPNDAIITYVLRIRPDLTAA